MTLVSKFRLIIDSIDRPVELVKVLLWRFLRLVGYSTDTIDDQAQDRIEDFNEYASCDICASEINTEKLVANDGSRIVECVNCGQWFTSPRVREDLWYKYLKTPSKRNSEFTKNRLEYGVALTANTRYAFPGWRKAKFRENKSVIEICEKHLGRDISRLHEVGCGVGYLLQDAQKLGISASGNELNGAACELMLERFKLPVEKCLFEEASIEPNSLDVVIMKDYIEHTYHPYQELLKSFELLVEGGVVYLETFHIECDDFFQQKEAWNMLFWNHTHHFSQKTLENAVKKAGFTVEWVDAKQSNLVIRLVAKKPSHNTAV